MADPPPPPEIPKSSRTQKPASGLSQFPNPPDSGNPDAATLRDQWKFAIRQYSKWYSHAWGTAILAGVSFFALGWFIKGSNPIPSLNNKTPDNNNDNKDNSSKDKDPSTTT